MINPALGLGVGILLSLFSVDSSSQADALKALYDQIMAEVQSMINDALVQENLASAYVTTSSVLMTWYQNPWYITHTPNTTSQQSAYYAWYTERTADFNTNLKDMFSPDCLQNDLQPQFPPNEVCQGFSAAGVLLQQIQYAQAHIFTFQAAAQVASQRSVALQQTQNSVDMTKKYARLLAASLTNWMDYASTMTCDYNPLPDDWGEKGTGCSSHGCWDYSKCDKCTAQLSPAAAAEYTYTRATVAETFGCDPSCYGQDYDDQPDDICNADSSYCSTACRTSQFEHMMTDWKARAKPQLMGLVRAFQLQFTSAEEADGKACACPAPQYLMMESNASTCQFLCRADVDCQAYEWTLEGEDADGGLVLNYSSPVNGTCKLFTCGYLLRWDSCVTSEECPSGTTCHVGDARCMTDGDCAWANEQDGTSRDCTPIPRTSTVDYFSACTDSDQCNGLYDFCHVGDKRCQTTADCDWLNQQEGTSRDCTAMPKTVRWNFTSIERQYCVNTTQEVAIAGVTDLEVCKANCGNSCNACALGPDGCRIYENCAPSVVWRDDGYTTYMKDLSPTATTANAGSSCTFVHYNQY